MLVVFSGTNFGGASPIKTDPEPRPIWGATVLWILPVTFVPFGQTFYYPVDLERASVQGEMELMEGNVLLYLDCNHHPESCTLMSVFQDSRMLHLVAKNAPIDSIMSASRSIPDIHHNQSNLGRCQPAWIFHRSSNEIWKLLLAQSRYKTSNDRRLLVGDVP